MMNMDLSRELLPPHALVKDGSTSLASYISVGESYRKIFQAHLPLREDMRVLEMGSGIGRISRQFLNILSDKGPFTGIEIMPAQVDWCNENLGTYPGFSFIRADILNSEYNPQGNIKASDYIFPFADNTLDLVVLTSVFTHMLRKDVAHYLREIGRVLMPGGHCFATFFKYSREEFPRIYAKDAGRKFYYPVYKENGIPLVMCADDTDLEEAVAYEREFLISLHAEAGLSIEKELNGSWLKREGRMYPGQDILIAVK